MFSSLARKINIYLLISVLFFMINNNLFAVEEKKEQAEDYIKEISSMMTDVDITMRNIGMNTFPMGEGIKRLDSYIFKLSSMEHPEDLKKEHKMILLSFKKMRIGLLLFSVERKDLSVGLIKNGIKILKHAAKNIINMAKKKGIIRDKKSVDNNNLGGVQ